MKYSNYLILFFLTFVCGSTFGQNANAVISLPLEGYYWKDQASIIQILDDEILKTTDSQKLPNSTKNKAILEAYKSLLVNSKSFLEKGVSVHEFLDKAFEVMMNEQGVIPYKRALLLNDMNIKKQELQLKLTIH
ncbi:MAG: hypothetical protein ABI851_13775 [Saprospiraceae bacterium]